MPNYHYECPKCKKTLVVHKPISESQTTEECTYCGEKMSRVYGFQTPAQFDSFYDEQYKTLITSSKQEQSLMKKHGHVYAADTPQHNKYKAKTDFYRKKRKGLLMSHVKSGR